MKTKMTMDELSNMILMANTNTLPVIYRVVTC